MQRENMGNMMNELSIYVSMDLSPHLMHCITFMKGTTGTRREDAPLLDV